MHIQWIDPQDFKRFDKVRIGEQHWGERLKIADPKTWTQGPEPFVLIGVPEDIGIRANGGRTGARHAWISMLRFLCQFQVHTPSLPESILILGTLDLRDLLLQADRLNPERPKDLLRLRKLTEAIDDRLIPVLQMVYRAHKIPILVGGGHNNAYGLIKAYGRPLHILNFDAHSDLRPLEGRHSGNAFRYAFEEELISNYGVIGLRESHHLYSVAQYFEEYPQRIKFWTLDAFKIRNPTSWEKILKQTQKWCPNGPIGLEIDLDVIAHMPSSASSPSGLTLDQIRRAIYLWAQSGRVQYLHLAEGAPSLEGPLGGRRVGQALALMIRDFVYGCTLSRQEVKF